MLINRLPCLVFRHIFSKLSFADVLQAGRVCPLWRVYQLEITSKVTCVTLLVDLQSHNNNQQLPTPLDLIARSLFYIAHRDELKAEDGFSPLFAPQLGSDWSRLCISNTLDLFTALALIEQLPNVTGLNVSLSYSDSSVIDHVILLLTNWKHQLSTFKFWCCFCGSFSANAFNSSQIHKLLVSLNSLANLSHLTLDISRSALLFWYGHYDADSVNLESVLRADFEFLSRLREFYFRYFNIYQVDVFYRWFKEVSQSNTRLEHVGFDISSPSLLMDLSKFVKKIAIMRKPSFYLPFEAFWEHVNRFTSLTTLSIRLNQPFPEVINQLAKFKQLIYLSISQSSAQAAIRMSNWDHTDQHSIAQLVSVKIVHLSLNIDHHSDTESCHWAWVFPNVQVLSIDHECFGLNAQGIAVTCQHYHHTQLQNVSQEQITSGIHDLLRTFKQCLKLHRIYLNESNITGQFVSKFKFML